MIHHLQSCRFRASVWGGVGFDPAYDQLANYAGSYAIELSRKEDGAPFAAGTISGWELYVTTNYSIQGIGNRNDRINVFGENYFLLGDYPADKQGVDIPVLENAKYKLIARVYKYISEDGVDYMEYSEFSAILEISTKMPELQFATTTFAYNSDGYTLKLTNKVPGLTYVMYSASGNYVAGDMNGDGYINDGDLTTQWAVNWNGSFKLEPLPVGTNTIYINDMINSNRYNRNTSSNISISDQKGFIQTITVMILP